MTTAEVTATFAGGMINGAGGAGSAEGLIMGIYTATKTNAGDYVRIPNMSEAKYAFAYNTVFDPCTVGLTAVVTASTGTGATTFFVWGI